MSEKVCECEAAYKRAREADARISVRTETSSVLQSLFFFFFPKLRASMVDREALIYVNVLKAPTLCIVPVPRTQ